MLTFQDTIYDNIFLAHVEVHNGTGMRVGSPRLL